MQCGYSLAYVLFDHMRKRIVMYCACGIPRSEMKGRLNAKVLRYPTNTSEK